MYIAYTCLFQDTRDEIKNQDKYLRKRSLATREFDKLIFVNMFEVWKNNLETIY
jgi:hypothetical protein